MDLQERWRQTWLHLEAARLLLPAAVTENPEMSGNRGREFGSRDRGNRRSPLGHSGRPTRGASEWRKQALHAVDRPAVLEEPRVCLVLRGNYRERPEHLIYRLDQQMARAGIAYHAECWGHRRGFAIYVAARHKEEVREIIARLLRSSTD